MAAVMDQDPEKTVYYNSESDRTEADHPPLKMSDGLETPTEKPADGAFESHAPASSLQLAAPPAQTTTDGTPPAAPPSNDIPDGGLTAWLQVLGSTAILVNTWGVINTFGVFQAYYESELLRDHSSSDISWIGSTQAGLLFLVGVVAGPLYDAGHFRHLLFVGLFLIVFGQFMTSLCTQFWQVMLAQGITMGVGMGLTFLPSAAILGQYFSRHRALALGLSSVGSPVAGVIFPIMFSRLQPQVGFGWATRAIAFILLAVSAVPIAFMRTRVPPRAKRSFIDTSALTDAPYVLFIAGGALAFLTLYVTFFYISLFAISHGVASESFAPYLVTLLNAGSVFGRIIPNALADRYGSLNLLIICIVASAVLVFGWLGIDNLGGAVVYTLLYGAFSGGVVSLTPSVIVGLSPDMSRVGARMGMGFLVMGVSILVGTPIAGAILGDKENPRWLGTILYAAFGLLVAAALDILSRFLLYRQKKAWKA
ncbi:major facilitator superfamily domain-containing protein [Dichotomopilus funicola]|uniref:Major facilitator superfamily domain-containing protein n=1 Tax=Dichotomopilus funicola TaxID=1934379 RepID=A0AAN6V440_9PEZI|nr:major facilitator superfamily domain-containing protein [Dichotomopilus funicola]